MFKKIIQKFKIIFLPVKENNYRPKFLESRVLFYCLIVLLILKLFTVPFFLFFPKNIFFATIVEKALVDLANHDRQVMGMEPLKENPQLKQAAFLKAKDMLDKDYFAHQSPEGVSPWHWFSVAGYNYQLAGENLAIGFLDSEQVHQAWLVSPGHRANLLNPNYQETGIAVVKGEFEGNETTIVVQLFASPITYPIEVKTDPYEKPPFEEEITKTEEEITQITEEVPEVLPVTQEQAEVLSEEVISRLKKTENELILGFFSFLSSGYYRFLQAVIYGFLILIVISLIINILFSFRVQNLDLIFKTVLFIGLLILFIFVDKLDMLEVVSQNFRIY